MYRWASELPDGVPVVITTADGVDIEYRGGLSSLDWEAEFQLFAQSNAPPVISLDIFFEEIDNVPKRVADGDDLSAMTASLYRWAPGKSYEDRMGVFFGIADTPIYGDVSEAVSVSFESPIYRDGATFPGRVEAGQITVDAALAKGQPYPIIFGAPRFSAGVDSAAAGSPAYPLVAADRTILAGILLGGSPAGTLWNTTQDAVETSTSASVPDLAGRGVVVFTSTHAMPISGITRSGGLATATTSSAHARESGDVVTVSGADQPEYNVTTRVTVTGDTTFVYPVSGTPVTPATGTITSTIFNAEDDYAVEWTGDDIGAGELLASLARMSTQRVDHSRMETTRARLNEFKFSGYIDLEASAWDFAVREILPLLPASAYTSPEGTAIRVWDDLVTVADVMTVLDVANGVQRVGRVRYENTDVINEMTVRYAPDYSGEYQKSIMVTGRIGLESTDTFVSPYAMASLSRMKPLDAEGPLQGVRSKVIETPYVFDDATAVRIAMWQIRARASRRRVVTYVDTQGHLEWLEEGEHVTITDPSINLSGHLAMIRSRRWRGLDFFIDLVLIDDILTR